MFQYDANFDDGSILLLVIEITNEPSRGQVQFCHNSIIKLFQRRNSPNQQQIPEKKDQYSIIIYHVTVK